MKRLVYILLIALVACTSQSTSTDDIGNNDVVTNIEASTNVAYRLVDMADNSAWIVRLKALSVTNSTNGNIRQNDTLNVFVRYSPDVDGYMVMGKFMPFYSNSETGSAIFLFVKGDSTFTYSCDIWCDYYTNLIRDWHNNQVYEFAYITPKQQRTEWEKSPLGYDTPFQFYDVDFDGEKELLVNDYRRGQGGNNYVPYKIKSGSLSPMEYAPFNAICNMTKFDADKKQIVEHTWDGAYLSADIYYTRHDNTTNEIQLPPSFYTPMLNENWHGYLLPRTPFAIDSIKEHVEENIYEYHMLGKTLLLKEPSIRQN